MSASVQPAGSNAPAVRDQLRYLIKGDNLPSASFQRRSLLRTARYALKFIFWRLVRYAKYALVGAAVAAAGTGILGTLTGGAGFILASVSPSIGLSHAQIGATAHLYRWQLV